MPRFEMRLSEELAERIDQARGDVPRGTWIKRAVESTLIRSGPPAKTGVVPPPPTNGSCPECGRFNGVHKRECSSHPANGG